MLHIAICDDMPQELERADSLLKKYACEHLHYEIKTDFFFAGDKIPILSQKYADFKRRHMDYSCSR